ncbi:MAG: hypothetical protein ABDH23_00605 [Endomicrobiia bacterium]
MDVTKKIISVIVILVSVTSIMYAPIRSFEFIGEVRAWWSRTNNAWDKTETILRPDGSAEFDDVNDFMFSDTKLGVRGSILRDVFGVIEVEKRDTLWATHNNSFNAEHYGTIGGYLGDPNIQNPTNYTGYKITKSYIVWDKIYDLFSVVVGRQFISGTEYPDPERMDLVLCMTMDGFRADIFSEYGKIMLFKAKLNESTAPLYAPHGGLAWETKYEDKDFDAQGVMVKSASLLPGHRLKMYLLNSIINDPAETNPVGKIFSQYDLRNILGFRVDGGLSFGLDYGVEFAYLFGEKYVTTYRALDPVTLNYVTKDYYGLASRKAFAFHIMAQYKRSMGAPIMESPTLLKVYTNILGGSGDDSTTPDDEGFIGLNDDWWTRARGYDHQGYGEIYKANPYQHNRFTSGDNPTEVYDGRYVEKSICLYPARIINLGARYEFSEGGKLQGLYAGFDFYLYNHLSPDGVIITNEDNQKEQTDDLGKEINLQIGYTYKYSTSFRLVLGWFFPGRAYINGKDAQTGAVIGADPVSLIKLETAVYFY